MVYLKNQELCFSECSYLIFWVGTCQRDLGGRLFHTQQVNVRNVNLGREKRECLIFLSVRKSLLKQSCQSHLLLYLARPAAIIQFSGDKFSCLYSALLVP